MAVKWIHGQYREDNRMFDSTWEAEEWADSLYSDFAGAGFVNVGYATPDEKVAFHIAAQLTIWLDWAKSNVDIPECTVQTATENADGKFTYKVWVVPVGSDDGASQLSPRQKWEVIPEPIQERILHNVWCTQCSDRVKIVNYRVYSAGRNIVLRGRCVHCNGEVARVVEQN